jgi:hypothetical protein
MKISPGAVVLGIVGLGAGVLGVGALREATLSTHQPIPSDTRIEVVVDAKERGTEPGQTLAEMVESKVMACRLEVNSDVVGEIEPAGEGRYRIVLAPTMDQTNRRQFRGCLEDWTHDHILIDVVSVDDVA